MTAARWYATALELPQTSVRIWYAYGRVLEKMGDWSRAGHAYRQYARLQRAQGEPVYDHQGGRLSFSKAIRYETLLRPDYAHAVRHAALLAQRLEVPKIRVAELGVASGRGLILLQEHASTIEELTGIIIEVWGFDTGSGLPTPTDYRDLPHFFGEGDYTMQDYEALQQKLDKNRTQLVLGDAAKSVADWLPDGPPIGAVLLTWTHTAPRLES